MREIKWGKMTLRIGDPIRAIVGRYVYVGTVTDITEYNDLIIEDLKKQSVRIKMSKASVIQILSTEEFTEIKRRYEMDQGGDKK